jgi:intracellular sulfur oxidation DsrE/DsrF family protein
MSTEEMINSERVLNDLGIWQKEVIARVIQNYADQEKKKATEALKNIQNLLSGEPSEENARDAYLIASDTLKLLNQQK